MLITIFYLSNPINDYLIAELLKNNFVVRLVTSDIKSADKLKIFSNPGYLQIIKCDFFNCDKFDSLVIDSKIVINMVKSTKDRVYFNRINFKIAEEIAYSCKRQNIDSLIHMSDLEVETVQTHYSKSRFLAEQAITKIFNRSIILRFSLIYGYHSFCVDLMIRQTIKYSVLPSIFEGNINLQPIHIENVSKILIEICNNYSNYNGIYKIAGQEILSVNELNNIYLKIVNKKLFKIPHFITKIFIKVVNSKLMYLSNRMFFGRGEPCLYSEYLETLQYSNTISNPNENLFNNPKFKDNIKLETRLKKLIQA